VALSLVTAPVAEPITTAVAKLHCRVDHSTDDALIDTLCGAARDVFETGTRRKCITQTWDMKLDRFPCWDEPIVLPFAPVASVTSVTYVDTNGDTQTWSSSYYTTDLPTGPQAMLGRIVPAYQQDYPQTRDVINAVTVRFVVGYGSAGTSVPAGMLAGMKLLIGHWYENRQSVITGTIATEIPQAVETLMWQFRAY
jgi:uncharacterized phiE125 gp8 family phage protein